MHIGVIAPAFPYKNSSESVFVEAIVTEFIKLGHKCTIIAPFPVFTFLQGKRAYGPRYEKRVIHNTYIEIYKPRFWGIKDIPIFGVSNSRFQAMLAIERTIKKYNLHFDIIYCHFFAQGFAAYRYAATYNIPLFVATGESSIPHLNAPFRGFTIDDFRNYLSGTICVSTKNMHECIKLGYSYEDKCVIIPNAVNLNLFKQQYDKNNLRDKLSLPKDKILIICVGEFSERKGQNRVIEAIVSLNNPDISIILIGQSLSKSFSLIQHPCIVYAGPVPHSDLPMYLQSSDIFVLPTLKEGCCNAIIEAMACGLPIISSDLSFNYDILSNKSALLVNPLNIEEISTAINKLVQNTDLRNDLAHAASISAEQLSLNNRANRILEFIKSRIYAVSQNSAI